MTNLDHILHKVTKPARYTGGEWNSIVKDWTNTPIRFALAYPDVYEIGMSNQALPILYQILNDQPDVLAERVFAPWTDMEAALRAKGIPLFSLETKHPLRDFDVLGFSLGHELTYTNVLNMLDLAQIPVLAAERNDSHPLVIAGGSCILNPEPMADFIDFFVIGEAEEVLLEVLGCLRRWKGDGKTSREHLLREVAKLSGIYVPQFYQVEYHPDGILKSFTPAVSEAKPTIQRRTLSKLAPPVTKPVVSYIEVVHDRGSIEIQRGCTRGCRFCQAGILYRPSRERPPEEIVDAVGELLSNCGYNEVSLLSLSTSDYSNVEGLVDSIMVQYPDANLKLSLPSLRMNNASIKLMETLGHPKATGLTFAPEAGSERLRRVINKDITEAEIVDTVTAAFDEGWKGLKLYLMLGLPTETMTDVQETIALVNKIYALGARTPGRRPQLRLSLATFVPKPHTPFQWSAQDTEDQLRAKYELLGNGLPRKGVKLSWNDPKASLLEAVLARGDRRLGKAIYYAWQQGATFDAWGEHFNHEKWQRAFDQAGLDPGFYAHRERSLDELLPWAHIDAGVSTKFLKREYQKAMAAQETLDCRTRNCNACGLERFHLGCQKKRKMVDLLTREPG
ncbi:MAG: TIGR03960 family B12-binding radical SAM protein [Chloroflexi bacterium]|nr:TIGR03960 family B12-binding radical SAM protein [Chloroflexota bacterium]